MPKITRDAAPAAGAANENEKNRELEMGIAQKTQENIDLYLQANAAEKANNDLLAAKALLEKEDAHWKSQEADPAETPAVTPAADSAPEAESWSRQAAELTGIAREQGKDRASLKGGWLPTLTPDNVGSLSNGESRFMPEAAPGVPAPAAPEVVAVPSTREASAPEIGPVTPPAPEANDGMEHVRKLLNTLSGQDLKRFRAMVEDVHAGNPLPKNGYGFLSPQTERDMIEELRSMPEKDFTKIRETILPQEETRRMQVERTQEKKGFWRRIFGGSRPHGV